MLRRSILLLLAKDSGVFCILAENFGSCKNYHQQQCCSASIGNKGMTAPDRKTMRARKFSIEASPICASYALDVPGRESRPEARNATRHNRSRPGQETGVPQDFRPEQACLKQVCPRDVCSRSSCPERSLMDSALFGAGQSASVLARHAPLPTNAISEMRIYKD